MQHDKRYGSGYHVQAAACGSCYVDGSYGRADSRKVCCHRVRNGHLEVWVGDRPEASRDAAHARQTRWKTHADVGPRITVERCVFTRHRIRFSAAIEARPDPGKIERGEIGACGWIGALQEHIRRAGLAGGICRTLCHLAVCPDLRVIGGQAKHRKQEECDEDDNKQECLSLLRRPSLQTGAAAFPFRICGHRRSPYIFREKRYVSVG